MYRGQILDGRNRYRACIELGIEPQLRAYDGPDPLGHAISLNVIRRQLSTIEKAQLALLIKPRLEEAAAERKAAVQAKPGDRLRAEGQLVSAPVRGPKDQALNGKASDHAAKLVGVSGRTVENVAFVQKNKPELLPEIKAGLLTIPQAVDRPATRPATRPRGVSL